MKNSAENCSQWKVVMSKTVVSFATLMIIVVLTFFCLTSALIMTFLFVRGSDKIVNNEFELRRVVDNVFSADLLLLLLTKT